jgi:LacI family transcriptional regulator, galactose operon repressor
VVPCTPHVAVLIETSRSYGRGLLRGVRRYLAEHGAWSVFMELRALDTKPPLWLKNWRGDGILTRTGTRAMADAVRRVGVPVVELRSPRLNSGAPWVGVDNRVMGKIVADHLMQRGFRHFGVCEIGTEVYFEQRRVNFIETVQQAGFDCSAYHAKGQPEKPAQWEKHQDDLATWVSSLPKPVGVMACTDQLGFFLLDACARAGVAVPEEVAVVGVENEESLCTMAMPTLSSVKFNAERIGYEAAAMLDRLMAGEEAPTEPLLIEPLGVITRGSSDVVAIDDPEIAQAVRFIRETACDGIAVTDVLKEVAISRSGLERRMRAAVGRSPNEEITRVRVERAKELLISTEQPLTTIARRTGFQTPQYLVQVFRRQVGVTPGVFRRERS